MDEQQMEEIQMVKDCITKAVHDGIQSAVEQIQDAIVWSAAYQAHTKYSPQPVACDIADQVLARFKSRKS